NAAENLVSELAQVGNMRGVSAAAVQKILKVAEHTYQQLSINPDNPRQHVNHLALLNAFGESYFAVADFKQALKVYSEGLAIGERLSVRIGQLPPVEREIYDELLREVSVLQNNLGNVFMAQGELDQALDSYLRGFAMMEQLYRGHPEWQHYLVMSYNNVGNAL